MHTSDSLLDRNEFIRQILHPTRASNRFVNLLLDAVFSTIFMYICGLSVGSLLMAFDMDVSENWKIVLGLSMIILPRVLYYTLLEYYFGKTIGKMITKTKVVTEDGEKPTLGQIIGRTFARFIPFEPFSFLGPPPIGWHDSLSGTMVVDDLPLYSLSQNHTPENNLYQD